MEKEAFEQTGLVPRSIIRTFDRFRKQLLPGAEIVVLQEFRISRYQVLVSVKCLAILFFIPILVNYLAKTFFLTPLTEYFWNKNQIEIFLNSCQQESAFIEIKDFEEKLYFESLIENDNFSPFFKQEEQKKPFEAVINNKIIKKKIQLKTLEIANKYNQESIEAITNLFGDFITFITISFLFVIMRPQIIILNSFLTESIYSLSDTTKSFLLILFTDLLVGFHSPRGWEFFLEIFFQHFGLSKNKDFVLLFVATFPVLLDTVFKYWIFRYLNKISPSTVATYHNMIE